MDSEQDSPAKRTVPMQPLPEDIVEYRRAKELAGAIHERLQAGFDLKREWITELLSRFDRYQTLQNKTASEF